MTAMRVALIDPSLFTLPYDRALAKGLQQAGCRVTLFARKPGPLDSDASGLDLAAHFYPVANSALAEALPRPIRLGVKGLDHAVSMLRLVRRLRRLKPNVIHFQWLNLPIVDRRMLAGLRRIAPLVLTVHDTNPFNGDPSAAVQQRGFFNCMAAFDRLIVHTEQGWERLLATGISAEKLVVLPHGGLLAAPASYVPDPMAGMLTFLLFGKVKPYKGLDLLIEAFAGIPMELRAQARLRVVGKPYMDMAPLVAQAASLGIAGQLVIEPRFVDDDEIPALFGPSVVAVFPYREIEASGVLSIALAHGRPVIASAIGNFAEVLNNGVHGHLISSGDVPALRDAMVHMLSDRNFAAQCSHAAHLAFKDIPSWTEIGRLTSSTYDAAVAAAHREDQRAAE